MVSHSLLRPATRQLNSAAWWERGRVKRSLWPAWFISRSWQADLLAWEALRNVYDTLGRYAQQAASQPSLTARSEPGLTLGEFFGLAAVAVGAAWLAS